MPSYPSALLRFALLTSASIFALLFLWTRNNHELPFASTPLRAAAPEMPYDPAYRQLVQPLIYGARTALFARTVDGGATSTNSSSTPRSDNSHPAVNPAIPAVLAVAVFVVCTCVVIKGARSLRGSGVTPVYRKPVVEEEKPRMYEVHMGRPPSPACIHAGEGWNGVMPVSLEYLPPYEPEPPSASPTRTSPIRPPLRTVATRASRSLSRDTPRSSCSTFPEKRTASVYSATEDPARMRVAVLIAMPSPTSQTPPSVAAPAVPAPAYLGLAEV